VFPADGPSTHAANAAELGSNAKAVFDKMLISMDVSGTAFAVAKQLCLPHPPNDCFRSLFFRCRIAPLSISRFRDFKPPPGAAMKTQFVRFYKA
jgi:hypothetical protein